jgi:hypothetical protein
MDKNSYLIRLCESARTDFGKVDFKKQSHAQRVYSAIWQLEGDVNNDGFDGFFLNSDPVLVAFTPVALRAIGAHSCAGIVERAMQTASSLGQPYSLLAVSSADLQPRLSELDSEFYQYPDNLTELLFEFVKSHPAEFGPIGDEPIA